MNCSLEFLYYATHPESSYVDFHRHNCYELVYYITGTGYMNLDGIAYRYQPNTITITLPQYNHDEKHLEETDVLFIGFTYEKGPIQIRNGLFFDDEQQTLLHILEEMKNELLEKKLHHTLKLDLLVSELLIEFDRIHQVSDHYFDELSYIKKFIDENYNQQINIQTLAELSGYSYHRFRHVFKEKMGLSPGKYIITQKVENAKQRLITTNLTISTIAHECGFSSSSLFTQQFKKLTGKTPPGISEGK
jgi:AraC-like DNA-binding protein